MPTIEGYSLKSIMFPKDERPTCSSGRHTVYIYIVIHLPFRNVTTSKLLFQLLSGSVGTALKTLRERTDASVSDKFLGSEATEELILLLNKSFDIMNTRIPKTGITKENWPEYEKVRLRHVILLKP